eukprot:762712-Hanusia_phi.AAC.1
MQLGVEVDHHNVLALAVGELVEVLDICTFCRKNSAICWPVSLKPSCRSAQSQTSRSIPITSTTCFSKQKDDSHAISRLFSQKLQSSPPQPSPSIARR